VLPERDKQEQECERESKRQRQRDRERLTRDDVMQSILIYVLVRVVVASEIGVNFVLQEDGKEIVDEE
jgi:hypothetical protein